MGGSRKATTTHSAATSTTLGKAELVQSFLAGGFLPTSVRGTATGAKFVHISIGIRRGSALRGRSDGPSAAEWVLP